jgi:hypothetical protein
MYSLMLDLFTRKKIIPDTNLTQIIEDVLWVVLISYLLAPLVRHQGDIVNIATVE